MSSRNTRHVFRLLTVAALVAAAFVAARPASSAPTGPVASGAAAPAIAASTAVAASTAASSRAAVRRFTLSTGMADGRMVFLDEAGHANPTLRTKVGETVEIALSSGEGGQHDIRIPALKVQSKHVDGGTAPATVRFVAGKAGSFDYFCTIAGHRQVGMEGRIEVAAADGAVPAPKAEAPAAGIPVVAVPPGALDPADSSAVSVIQDPTAVPAAPMAGPPRLVKTRIETVELAGKLDDGTTFTYWTFGRKVPGPMLRVRAGDTVELTLANAADSKQVHSIDLHAVTGPGGGAEVMQVSPGKEKTFTFKALNPGLYVYHCATPSVPHHISAGMYGLILVEPQGGLAKVDREFYVMQGDLYTKATRGAKGHQPFDHDKLAAELPDYYVFNGAAGALTKENALKARVGETVRIYFGVGDPNKISSFHVIGEIFDTVYNQGATNAPQHDVQTTLVAPGGAAIVEFKVEQAGRFLLVDHALSRVGKGLVGVLEVGGPADASVSHEGPAEEAVAHAAH